LNLLLSDGDRRILDDMGTGSYVDPSLHWYRSTLAHNAPMLEGRSQPRASGWLDAWEDRGAAGWISARVELGAGRQARRTVVAMPDYVVDQVDWSASFAGSFELPLHVDADAFDGARWIPASLEGGTGEEDGFRFLTDTRRLDMALEQAAVRLRGRVGEKDVDVWVAGHAPFELWKATAPGAPGRAPASFILLRSRDSAGQFRILWSWAGAVKDAVLLPSIDVSHVSGRHVHSRVEHGWHVEIEAGSARSSIDLEGLEPATASADESTTTIELETVALGDGGSVRLEMAERSYRRAEASWTEAGCPRASVEITRRGRQTSVDVTVSSVERTFVPENAVNRLDNERPDTNGAGLQLYLAAGGMTAGYVIVPESESSAIRLRPIDGWGSEIAVSGHWRPTADGYLVRLDIDRDIADDGGLAIDLIVNEKPAGRERRRGQLVLSGGAGEWVYLRGDRHDADRLISFVREND
jgi:hypothetical protein